MNALGIDIGTSSVCAVLVDCETGRALDTRSGPNCTALRGRAAYERIQDAEGAANSVLEAVRAVRERFRVDAIGLTGQMHGVLYTDADGRAVSPLFTWQDGRGDEKAPGGTYAQVVSRAGGRRAASGYGAVTHYWHTVNGAVPHSARRICSVYDYAGMRLTGRKEPLTHSSTAASIGLYDADRGSWDAAAAGSLGIDVSFFPEVTDGYALLGRDGDGIPVACGIGDNQASFIGSVRPDGASALVNLGTGGQISMLAESDAATEGLEIRPLGEKRKLLVGSTLCGGRAYALLEKFLRSCAALAGCDAGALYEAMDAAALSVTPGERPLEVDTRFCGTRSEPGRRGSVVGIGEENFDAAHMIAGTAAGMAEEMKELYRAMLAAGCREARQIVGSGNALRRNRAVRRAFEAAFGRPVLLPLYAEEAAYGAALCAMRAAGIAPTIADAQKLIAYAGAEE